jgi:deoxycytidine triphosphate deaminase
MAYSAEDFFANYRKTFAIAPFKPIQVTPLGYDLRLGFMVSADSEDTVNTDTGRVTSTQTAFTIKAGRAGIAVTLERIFLSGKVLGTVHARARLSLRGLTLNAVTVDPNFGYPKSAGKWAPGSRLLLRIQNTSSRDIKLTTEDDAIATLVLHEVQTETNRRPASPGLPELLDGFRKVAPEAISADAAKAIIEEIDKRAKVSNKDGFEDWDKAEKEFQQAADELIHFRELLRSREKAAK